MAAVVLASSRCDVPRLGSGSGLSLSVSVSLGWGGMDQTDAPSLPWWITRDDPTTLCTQPNRPATAATTAATAAASPHPFPVVHEVALGAATGDGDASGAPWALTESLPDAMARLGHARVDVLKVREGHHYSRGTEFASFKFAATFVTVTRRALEVDIEGGEWGVLDALLDRAEGDDDATAAAAAAAAAPRSRPRLPFEQLLIELHTPETPNVERFVRVFERLEVSSSRDHSTTVRSIWRWRVTQGSSPPLLEDDECDGRLLETHC